MKGTKTHCLYGHAYDAANTYVDGQGYSHCRACDKAKHAKRRAARRKYTTGDKVIVGEQEWYVSKTEWVWNPYDGDPDYCQRVTLVKLDEAGEVCNVFTGLRNTDIDGLATADAARERLGR
jgi:hypothetical protein